MALNRLPKFLLKACLISTAAVGSMALMPEANAACLDTSCSTFDSRTLTSVSNSSFTGSASSKPNFNTATVRFAISGTWNQPFTISGITLTGDGIASPLAFNDVTFNGAPNNRTTNELAISLPGGTFDFANSTINFIFQPNATNFNSGATISARLRYFDNADPEDSLVSTNDFISTSVPGPLPLLGIGASFGFSRKLRKRINNQNLLPSDK
ncbi:MAG: hypothetical protein ACK5GZ_07940 [Cyanobium sp.]|jgi:hypothetical protein